MNKKEKKAVKRIKRARFHLYGYDYSWLHNEKLDGARGVGQFYVIKGTSWDEVAQIQDELEKELKIRINTCWRIGVRKSLDQ